MIMVPVSPWAPGVGESQIYIDIWRIESVIGRLIVFFCSLNGRGILEVYLAVSNGLAFRRQEFGWWFSSVVVGF